MSHKTTFSQPRAAATSHHRVSVLLEVISNGSGEELLTLRDLKITGAHPFSDSTRHRKIRNREYPSPIKISPQMCVWKVADIRAWRSDPAGYKSNVKVGGKA